MRVAPPVAASGARVPGARAAGMTTLYAFTGGTSPLVVTALFMPPGLGLGLRGPPGFFRAVLASHGDDARGSALVILAILATTAAGTAAVAPWIESGLVPLASASFAIEVLARFPPGAAAHGGDAISRS